MTHSRYRGCLLGLAAGDAVGTTLEFELPGSFTPIDDMCGGGPFNLMSGQWTDDTSMALCLATSLIEKNGFDARDQMSRYVRWWKEGYLSSTGRCFDIGNTVRGALARFVQNGEPFAGSVAIDQAGNGSLMRLAPVPLFFAGEPIKAVAMSGESSNTTHATPAAVDACRYFAGLIVGALNGVDKNSLLAPLFCPVDGYWKTNPLQTAIAAIAEGSFKTRNPPQIRGTGFVVSSLEAAMWAFYHADSYREAILLAANLGDDADTTAAICGQLAGAYWGDVGIPAKWIELLTMREAIISLADRLYAVNAAGV